MKKKSKIKRSRKSAGRWVPIEAPQGIALDYYKFLMSYTRRVARIFDDIVMPVIDTSASDCVYDSDVVGSAFIRFLRKVRLLSPKAVTKGVTAMVNGAAAFQRQSFIANCKRAVGIDVTKIIDNSPIGNEIKKAIARNTRLISTIEDDYARRARKILQDGLSGGADGKSIKKQIRELGGFRDQDKGIEQRRAKVIARDQTQKTMSAIDRARQEHIGIKHFDWMTSGDQRVRSEHKKRNRKRYAWDNPPDGVLPGDDPLCRCTARPDIDELIANLEEEE